MHCIFISFQEKMEFLRIVEDIYAALSLDPLSEQRSWKGTTGNYSKGFFLKDIGACKRNAVCQESNIQHKISLTN
jgi:hypothetical protein